MSVPLPGYPSYDDPTGQYYYNQRQNQQAAARAQAYDQYRLLLELYQQQAQNLAQGVYNANAVGGAQNQLASLGYNLAGDQQNQLLRALGMQGDVLRQQRADTQYQRQLQEDVARTQHQQSINEVPTNFGYAKHLLGY